MSENYKNEINIDEIIVNIFIFIRKNIMILAIFGILGGIIGGLKYFRSKPLYSTTLTGFTQINDDFSRLHGNSDIITHNYSSELVVNYINSLEGLIKNDNKFDLAKTLGVSNEIAISISEIKANFLYPISGTEEESDKKRKNFIKIEIYVNDNNKLDSIQNGLLYAINNNKFINKKIANRKKALSEKIQLIKHEIGNLDKEINKRLELLEKNQQASEITMHNRSLNSEKVTLKGQEETFKIRLKEFTPLDIVTGFNKPYNNQNSLLKTLAVFIAIFLFLGIIIVIVIGYFKKAGDIIRK